MMPDHSSHSPPDCPGRSVVRLMTCTPSESRAEEDPVAAMNVTADCGRKWSPRYVASPKVALSSNRRVGPTAPDGRHP